MAEIKIQTINEYFLADKSFDIDLVTSNTFFKLEGKNGVGKSSLFELFKVYPSLLPYNSNRYVLSQGRLTPVNSSSLSDLLKEIRKLQKRELKGFKTLNEITHKFKDTPICELSAGQNQLAKLLIMLFIGGDYLFLDEPLQNLDTTNQKVVAKILMDLKKDVMGLWLIEHDWPSELEHGLDIIKVSSEKNLIKVSHA